MTKYRKKPIIIDAEQFWPHEKPWPIGVKKQHGNPHLIETLEGDMIVTPGDWIIMGVKGEKYPCKPDIFEMTYEKAEE